MLFAAGFNVDTGVGDGVDSTGTGVGAGISSSSSSSSSSNISSSSSFERIASNLTELATAVVVIIVVIIVVAIVIVVAGKPNNVGFVDDQVRTPRLTTRTMQSPDKRGVDTHINDMLVYL